MRTHVALLRGINVGGRNKVAMPDLREIVSALGHSDVATYIQSGNVVFSSSITDTDALAQALKQEIAGRLGVQPDVVVLSREQLAQVIADNPYPDETTPRCLHAVFRQGEVSPAEITALAAMEQQASDKGGRDEAAAVGRTLFLHTPDGLGRSELAAQLGRSKKINPGTARNWATVTKLMALLDD